MTININENVGKIAVPGLGERSNLKDESTWGSKSMNSSVLKGFCPWEQEKKCHKLKSAISHKTLSGKITSRYQP